MLGMAYALAAIAVGLLIIYGADVAASQDGESFLPLDEKERGMGLGVPSLILPIAAFVISRKNPSKGLGALIAAAGALIIAGGAATLDSAGEMIRPESAMLFGAGALIAALGTIKIRRS